MGRPKKYVYQSGDVIGHGWRFLREGRGGAGQRCVWVVCPVCQREVERALGSMLLSRAKTTRSCGCDYKEALSRHHRRREPKEAAVHEYLLRYRKNSIKRGHPFELTNEQCARLFNMPCFYCNTPPSLAVYKRSYSASSILLNGIDRYDSSLGYVEGNVVPCCKTCNLMKNVLHGDDFVARVRSIQRWLDLKAQQEPSCSSPYVHATH